MDRGTERGGQRHGEGAEGGAHKRRGVGREQRGSRHRQASSLLPLPPAGASWYQASRGNWKRSPEQHWKLKRMPRVEADGASACFKRIREGWRHSRLIGIAWRVRGLEPAENLSGVDNSSFPSGGAQLDHLRPLDRCGRLLDHRKREPLHVDVQLEPRREERGRG
eukprot:1950031-Pleurochrysis_carterae.AAC.1